MFGRTGIPTVQPDEVPEDVLLLDVREAAEWEAGHVEGALHIPLMDLPDRLGELSPDSPVVVVCRSGHRSAQATAWLVQQGYEAANLDGGMFAWASSGRPLHRDDGLAAVVL